MTFVPGRTRDGYHHGDLPRVLRATARALVSKHGAVGFSLRAAAKEAGVDPAAVYRHYADKDALLVAVASEGYVELAAAMEHELAKRRTPETRFIGVGEAYVRFALAEPELFRLMFGRNTVDPAAVDQAAAGGRRPFRILLDCLQELADAGKLAFPPRRAALPAWSAVHGLSYLAIEGRIDDVDQALRIVLETLLRGLA